LAHRSHHVIRSKVVNSTARRPTSRRLQGRQFAAVSQKRPEP
jgi:hypothetical protein